MTRVSSHDIGNVQGLGRPSTTCNTAANCEGGGGRGKGKEGLIKG